MSDKAFNHAVAVLSVQKALLVSLPGTFGDRTGLVSDVVQVSFIQLCNIFFSL